MTSTTIASPMQQREWRSREEVSPDIEAQIRALALETRLSPLTVRVCWLRGLRDAAAIRHFLAPRLEALKDPFSIRDMDAAVDRLILARERGESVRIFGDYDVDGTTGTALLSWFFRESAMRFDARQPDRFKDGYGLNPGAVDEAADAGVKLLVTVDCGITSFAAAERARERGVDLIVVDHHQLDPVRGLPAAIAVVNPQREDCESGLRQLCGCGLAFYLARALRTKGREQAWWPAGSEPNLKRHLDLVAMATAADLVPLTGDNHILVRHGLEVLKQSAKPGVRALLESAGVGQRELSPSHLGFVIGPRINASGRMGSASLALELLTTEDPARAREMAETLERVNAERAELQNRIWDEVRAKVEAGIAEGKYEHGIVVADANWHEGVVGIVASRVVEHFRKPAAVLAIREDHAKGSVRTWAGKDVLAALRECSDLLKTFGGHRHAAGLSVENDQLDALAEAFDLAVSHLEEDESAKPLLVDADCALSDLNIQTLMEIECLGPFGPGNPEPVFTCRAEVRSHRVLKERHLKLSLQAAPGQAAARLPDVDGIWFHAAEREELFDGARFAFAQAEFAAVPELNRFRGRVTPTLRIRDFRPSSN